MKILLKLYSAFFKIGLFTFGGGLAMLPQLQREIVDNNKWATTEELLNYFAIGQCTPGIIAINTATFIGYKQKGISGAIVATFGMVSPSLIIISILSQVISSIEGIEIVQHAFAGLRVGVVALIAYSIINLWKQSVKDIIGIIIFVCTFVLVAFLGVSPIIVIVVIAFIGAFHKGGDASSD